MKILLIGMTQFRYMPYMNFYLNCINSSNNDVHIITWNRDDTSDCAIPENITNHVFNLETMDFWPLRKKAIRLLKFRHFAKKVIKNINPDLLIIHYSTTAFLLSGVLKSKYKEKYIFDFRDITYEKNGFFRRTIERIVNDSVLSFTSSDGFREFLPSTPKLITTHNIDFRLKDTEHHQYNFSKHHYPIRISFWGLLRSFETNKKLIESLGNNSKFELHYYGRSQGRLAELMKESVAKYPNVFYHGPYFPEEKEGIISGADLINNVFDPHEKTMSLAMSNKYYDGILFHIPQLCCKESFMGKKVSLNKTGLEIDLDNDDLSTVIDEYYQGIDDKRFNSSCDSETKAVLKDIEKGQDLLIKVLNGQKVDLM